jgi:hypothetical protein
MRTSLSGAGAAKVRAYKLPLKKVLKMAAETR